MFVVVAVAVAAAAAAAATVPPCLIPLVPWYRFDHLSFGICHCKINKKRRRSREAKQKRGGK